MNQKSESFRLLVNPTAQYAARLARDGDEIRAAQALRFQVFNLELNEGFAQSYATGLDADPFDAVCDHLLVEHLPSQQIVGTYRLQTGANAAQKLGYYCAQEFEFEGTGFSDFFEQIFGSRMRGGNFAGPGGFGGGRVAEQGRDIEGDIMVTLEEAQRGSVRTVTVRHENRTDSQQVKIPAGIIEGQKLRIAGRGEGGGDLYLRVRLAKHPDFEVDGHNLIHELELAPWEAALGAEIAVPTLEGRVNIKIPPGTASGQKLRVRGRGLGKTGDLLVTTKIVVPAKISDAQRKLWELLARESKFNPRD